MLRVPFLDQGEGGIECDHDDDRQTQRDALRGQRQERRQPQQERQWMDQLPHECRGQPASMPGGEDVWPYFGQPPGRLDGRETVLGAVQPLQEVGECCDEGIRLAGLPPRGRPRGRRVQGKANSVLWAHSTRLWDQQRATQSPSARSVVVPSGRSARVDGDEVGPLKPRHAAVGPPVTSATDRGGVVPSLRTQPVGSPA
jgi:hypothetical protein